MDKSNHPTQLKRPRGYTLPLHLRVGFREYFETKLWLTMLAAAWDHLVIILSAVTGAVALSKLPLIYSVPIQLVVVMVIANRQRGLEVLTHEGSHCNWTRRHSLSTEHRLNDALTNGIAALPMFSTVEGFRTPHRLHHSQFGSHLDACNLRYRLLALDSLNANRRDAFKFIRLMAARLLGYSVSWWQNIRTTKRTLLLAACWHAAYLILIGGTLFVTTDNFRLVIWLLFPCWLGYWLVPMITVLNILRFVAEANKHQYLSTTTLFDATFTNLGWSNRWFHPHNDQYHLIHHLFPYIPHHQLRHANEFLQRADAQRFGADSRARTGVFCQPHKRKAGDRLTTSNSAGRIALSSTRTGRMGLGAQRI